MNSIGFHTDVMNLTCFVYLCNVLNWFIYFVMNFTCFVYLFDERLVLNTCLMFDTCFKLAHFVYLSNVPDLLCILVRWIWLILYICVVNFIDLLTGVTNCNSFVNYCSSLYIYHSKVYEYAIISKNWDRWTLSSMYIFEYFNSFRYFSFVNFLNYQRMCM